MLIDCIKVQDLWSKVETWIQSLAMVDCHLTDRKTILGDLENTSQINLILLNVKKTFIKLNWTVNHTVFYRYSLI